MSPIWWAIVGLVFGGFIGAAVVWLASGRSGQGREVKHLKEENARFREEVTEHFVETAEKINHLTDAYKAVFDHLSAGAEKLVDKKTLQERLPAGSEREVRLRLIGAPREEGGQDREERAGESDSGGKSGSTKAPASEVAPEKRPQKDPLKAGAVRSPYIAQRPKSEGEETRK